MSEPKPWMVETLIGDVNESTQYETEAKADAAAKVATEKPGITYIYIRRWVRLRREWQHVRTVL